MANKKLGEACDFYNGLWKGKKPPYIKASVIRNTNFSKDGMLDYSNVAVLDVEEKQFATRSLQFSDIILEKSGGGPKQPVGRVVFFDKMSGDHSFSNFTSAIRIKNHKELDPYFLHKFLHFFYISGMTEVMQKHSTGIRNLNLNAYKDIEIPLPSLPEQKRIVKILDEAFEKIEKAKENTEKNLKNARELFESYLQEVFENPGDDWVENSLNNLCDETANINWRENENNEFKYIDLSSVSRGTLQVTGTALVDLTNAPSRAKKVINTNDVIFATTRPTLKRVTKISSELDNQLCSTGYVVLRSKKDVIEPDLLFYFLQTNSFMDRMESLERGTSYPAVTDKDVKNTMFLYPATTKEQKTIVKKLDELSGKTKKLEEIYQKKLDNLEELKKSILQKAFSGEL